MRARGKDGQHVAAAQDFSWTCASDRSRTPRFHPYCIGGMIFSCAPWRPKWGLSRKTITVTEQENEWIEARIDGGDFTNDSEYIRDSIRGDQDCQSEVDAIRGELIQGAESGEPQAFDDDLFKEQMAAKHARKVR